MSNQNQMQRRATLLGKNIDVEPVGVVYNLESHVIEEQLTDYLKNVKKLEDLGGVRLIVYKDGGTYKVRIAAFFSTDSKEFNSNVGDILKSLKKKLGPDSYNISDKVKQALRPLCRKDEINMELHSDKLIVIELGIFQVLGMLLDGDRRFDFTITNIEPISRSRSVITVVKRTVFQNDDYGKDYDHFRAVLSNMSGD